MGLLGGVREILEVCVVYLLYWKILRVIIKIVEKFYGVFFMCCAFYVDYFINFLYRFLGVGVFFILILWMKKLRFGEVKYVI